MRIMKISSAPNSTKCPWLLVVPLQWTPAQASKELQRVKQQGIATSLFPSSHQNEMNTSAFDQICQYTPYQTSYDSHKSFQKSMVLLRKKKSVQSVQFPNMSIDFIKIFSAWHFMRFDILQKAGFYPKMAET